MVFVTAHLQGLNVRYIPGTRKGILKNVLCNKGKCINDVKKFPLKCLVNIYGRGLQCRSQVSATGMSFLGFSLTRQAEIFFFFALLSSREREKEEASTGMFVCTWKNK